MLYTLNPSPTPNFKLASYTYVYMAISSHVLLLHVVCCFLFFVVVVVSTEGPCDTGDVRLVGGEYPSEGRVEICLNNAYGTICDVGWTNEDARVICRQLGYNNGTGI